MSVRRDDDDDEEDRLEDLSAELAVDLRKDKRKDKSVESQGYRRRSSATNMRASFVHHAMAGAARRLRS